MTTTADARRHESHKIQTDLLPATTLPHVAYFSMEMAIDQSIYTYAGGLGYLAGSHMRSAGGLDLPMVGVTMLWKEGYGEQEIEDGKVKLTYKDHATESKKHLEATNVVVEVQVFGEPVRVTAWKLKPETFGTIPVYFLTTDVDGNADTIKSWTDKLYDSDEKIRIAQEIILGIGGLRLLQAAGVRFDEIHMNEGHALPAAFELLAQHHGNLDETRQRVLFTTHTPVAAGNETHPAALLHEAGFFAGISPEVAIQLGGDDFSLTVGALRMSRKANGVSQLHGEVANSMWNWVNDRCPIDAITNAVNLEYWQDPRMVRALHQGKEALLETKRQMKGELFDYVKAQTGRTYDPEVLTIVWARRFTEYKRATLLFKDEARIARLLEAGKLQLLFAGKFHPKDDTGRQQFNTLLQYAEKYERVTVLRNYDLFLSGLLKRGSDVWLNNPLRPLEASGTSGMSANMNGALHLSTYDGWAVEGTYHGLNGFLINPSGETDYVPLEERHKQDYESMMRQLENHVLPLYYDQPQTWAYLMQQAMRAAGVYFNSDRMAMEYYNKLYT